MSTPEKIVDEITKRPDILEKLAKSILPELEKSMIIRELRELRKTLQASFNKMLARLEGVELEQGRLREDFNKMIQELVAIREEQGRLREDFNKMLARLEGVELEQGRLREDFNKMMQELVAIREEQGRLREDFNKMLARLEGVELEQGRLREDFNKMLARLEGVELEQKRLREDFNKIMVEVRELRISYRRLDAGFRRLESRILVGFDSLRRFAGVTFEEFVREMLTRSLQKLGVLSPGARLERRIINGEEINLFCERPLIVGEVTSFAESSEEVYKLLRKAKLVEERYGEKPKLILVILAAEKEAAKEIKELADKYGIELLLGKTK